MPNIQPEFPETLSNAAVTLATEFFKFREEKINELGYIPDGIDLLINTELGKCKIIIKEIY